MSVAVPATFCENPVIFADIRYYSGHSRVRPSLGNRPILGHIAIFSRAALPQASKNLGTAGVRHTAPLGDSIHHVEQSRGMPLDFAEDLAGCLFVLADTEVFQTRPTDHQREQDRARPEGGRHGRPRTIRPRLRPRRHVACQTGRNDSRRNVHFTAKPFSIPIRSSNAAFVLRVRQLRCESLRNSISARSAAARRDGPAGKISPASNGFRGVPWDLDFSKGVRKPTDADLADVALLNRLSMLDLTGALDYRRRGKTPGGPYETVFPYAHRHGRHRRWSEAAAQGVAQRRHCLRPRRREEVHQAGQ